MKTSDPATGHGFESHPLRHVGLPLQAPDPPLCREGRLLRLPRRPPFRREAALRGEDMGERAACRCRLRIRPRVGMGGSCAFRGGLLFAAERRFAARVRESEQPAAAGSGSAPVSGGAAPAPSAAASFSPRSGASRRGYGRASGLPLQAPDPPPCRDGRLLRLPRRPPFRRGAALRGESTGERAACRCRLRIRPCVGRGGSCAFRGGLLFAAGRAPRRG